MKTVQLRAVQDDAVSVVGDQIERFSQKGHLAGEEIENDRCIPAPSRVVLTVKSVYAEKAAAAFAVLVEPFEHSLRKALFVAVQYADFRHAPRVSSPPG